MCVIDDCDGIAPEGSYCLKHLTRWIRYGDASVNKKPGMYGPAAALEARTQKSSDPDGCWIWTGAIDGSGYGTMRIKNKSYSTHRVAYELARGEIPEGLFIDHLCRNRLCVNPSHMEPVTHVENQRRARSEFCERGHPMSGDNLRVTAAGRRSCRECDRLARSAKRQESVHLRDATWK